MGGFVVLGGCFLAWGGFFWLVGFVSLSCVLVFCSCLSSVWFCLFWFGGECLVGFCWFWGLFVSWLFVLFGGFLFLTNIWPLGKY